MTKKLFNGEARAQSGDRVVFNIAGNKYRLVTYSNDEFRTIYVRFVGTHKEYDEVDVENV